MFYTEISKLYHDEGNNYVFVWRIVNHEGYPNHGHIIIPENVMRSDTLSVANHIVSELKKNAELFNRFVNYPIEKEWAKQNGLKPEPCDFKPFEK